MIILGIIRLIIGFIAKIAVLWAIGIILLVLGAVLSLPCSDTGAATAGTRAVGKPPGPGR